MTDPMAEIVTLLDHCSAAHHRGLIAEQRLGIDNARAIAAIIPVDIVGTLGLVGLVCLVGTPGGALQQTQQDVRELALLFQCLVLGAALVFSHPQRKNAGCRGGTIGSASAHAGDRNVVVVTGHGGAPHRFAGGSNIDLAATRTVLPRLAFSIDGGNGNYRLEPRWPNHGANVISSRGDDDVTPLFGFLHGSPQRPTRRPTHSNRGQVRFDLDPFAVVAGSIQQGLCQTPCREVDYRHVDSQWHQMSALRHAGGTFLYVSQLATRWANNCAAAAGGKICDSR